MIFDKILSNLGESNKGVEKGLCSGFISQSRKGCNKSVW